MRHRSKVVEQAYQLPKEYYENLYWKEGKETREIAIILGISQPMVGKIMEKLGVRRKTRYENHNRLGQKNTIEQNQKISAALKNNDNGVNPVTGKSHKWAKVTVNCAECGAIIEKSPSRAKKDKLHFCNHKCCGLWKSKNLTGENNPHYSKVKVNCLKCRKEMLRAKGAIKKIKYGFFCSKQCEGDWKASNLTGNKIYNFKGGYS